MLFEFGCILSLKHHGVTSSFFPFNPGYIAICVIKECMRGRLVGPFCLGWLVGPLELEESVSFDDDFNDNSNPISLIKFKALQFNEANLF